MKKKFITLSLIAACGLALFGGAKTYAAEEETPKATTEESVDEVVLDQEELENKLDEILSEFKESDLNVLRLIKNNWKLIVGVLVASVGLNASLLFTIALKWLIETLTKNRDKLAKTQQEKEAIDTVVSKCNEVLEETKKAIVESNLATQKEIETKTKETNQELADMVKKYVATKQE